MILFNSIRIAEGIPELLMALKDRIETRVNLKNHNKQNNISISQNMLLRICFISGLALDDVRSIIEIENIKYHNSGNNIHDTVFVKNNMQPLWSALLKLQYKNYDIDLENQNILKKIINFEIKRGAEYLLRKDVLENWMLNNLNFSRQVNYGTIPCLSLNIGEYTNGENAMLDLNSIKIPNTQILIAGATGSGKSNLIAVLLNEIRSLSIESSYPVNFLLFDYKGEFSDPVNNAWLNLFEVDRVCIYDPITTPLPFNPFKDFTGKSQNEINLYSTELAEALSAIDNTKISANMSNRLSVAIINSYKKFENKPITFERILKEYIILLSIKDQDKDDSITSVLKQLIRTNIFSLEDTINLVKESIIVKMDSFPKDGPLAKAIVYFIISKLNSIYEKLPKQATNEQFVELRHFTIIDEAHYMLGFDNKPLRELIAIGRNKGLSIILATQNMDSYKSEYFDFYANAQYPLIMKQQSMNDGVIRDLFGVSGKDFQEIKEAISSLQKGELIIKNLAAIKMGVGKKYRKIKVKHLI